MTDALLVNEIFLSIQGEGTRAGRPCTLIRLGGCNLRCTWCDTTYALEDGTPMPPGQVIECVRDFACPLVELTGGEPLLQPGSLALMARLCDDGCEVLLETNGSADVTAVDPRVVRIVDIKCPSSGMDDRMRWENLDVLRPADELKFVLADREDFDYACHVLRTRVAPSMHDRANWQHAARPACTVIFSPVLSMLQPATLAGWILDAGLMHVRLGLQLHKIIWPQKDRGV